MTVQTGGLSRATVADICAADLPELRNLTLWFGVDDYGGDCTVKDLQKLLSGSIFPNLEHLGLQDSPLQDEIAEALAASPLLARLEGLDLSMGTLSDRGVEALLGSPHLKKLQHLNIRHHYVSPPLVRRLEALGIELNARDRQSGAEDDRYVEVSE